MRWLKHITNAHDDHALSAVLEEFGPEGYGMYWLLLEHLAIGIEKDSLAVPSRIHSDVVWSNILHCSTRRFRKFAQTLHDLRLISCRTHAELMQNSCKTAAERFQIDIPKLLKYRDEYSKKSGQNPDKLAARVDREKIESREEGEQIPPPQAPPGKPPARPPSKNLEVVPKNPPDFDAESWFEKLYSRHPKKRDRGLGQSNAAQSIAAGADPAEIDRVHMLMCETEKWRWKNGASAPTLAEWFLDQGWKYPPDAKARDSPELENAHMSPREKARYEELMRD